MRLIFIPGFSEDETIFDKIHPHLPGEKLFLNNWLLLGQLPRPGLTVLANAEMLAKKYGITAADVVIGHSTGGWIAYHLQPVVGCRVIQIASWTDKRKVAGLKVNRQLVYWAAKRGLLFTRLVKNYLIRRYYRNKPSCQIFNEVYENLITRKRANVVNQLRVIHNPVPQLLAAAPDLRIHARGDRIVGIPDQSFQEVPGDHFALYTHPEHVYRPIGVFLRELR